MLQTQKKLKTHSFILAGTRNIAFNKDMSEPAVQKTNVSSSEELSHEDLIQKIASEKDKPSFIKLFAFFAPRLKSFLIKGGLAPESAEEVVQESMLSVWKRAKTFDPKKASASTWIFTIARNKKIDVFRKLKRAEYDPLDPLLDQRGEVENYVDNILHRQNARKLKEVIKELPEEQSILIQKAFYEEKTHQAIAEEMNIPLGTVKSRIRLGMERLRHALSGEDMKEMVG